MFVSYEYSGEAAEDVVEVGATGFIADAKGAATIPISYVGFRCFCHFATYHHRECSAIDQNICRARVIRS